MLEHELQSLGGAVAEPVAGISAVDKTKFASAMKRDKECERNVAISWQNVLHIEHSMASGWAC